jgi:hypothetical protein
MKIKSIIISLVLLSTTAFLSAQASDVLTGTTWTDSKGDFLTTFTKGKYKSKSDSGDDAVEGTYKIDSSGRYTFFDAEDKLTPSKLQKLQGIPVLEWNT